QRPGPGITFAYSLVFALAFPWLHDWHWGQVSTIVWALTIMALRAWCRGHRPLAALGLSLAISIKLFPVWFLLAFAFVGDKKGLVWVSFLSGLWLFALPAAVLGPEATWQYYLDLGSRLRPSDDPGSTSSQWWSSETTQFVPAILARLWGAAGGLWLVLAWVLPLGTLALILKGMRRCLLSGRFSIALVLCASALPLVLSPSWIHYFVWLPWALFYGWQAFANGPARFALAAGMVFSSTPFFFLMGGHPAYGRGGFLALASLCVPLAYVLSEPVRQNATTTQVR
ncbi:MAG: glycosyltransferase family 87 protein, partial [Planctomycetota bacterium]|nr:glycosyltransferase family 87 protein [Planctomycetota bacterium]